MEENTNKRADNFMVFDFETGGLKCKKHLAIEFAAIWVDSYDFREIDRYEDLILPYSDELTIEQAALNANGIKLEEIAEKGVEVEQVVKTIIEKTEKCNAGKMRGKKTILVGQNVQFDIGYLQQIFNTTKQDKLLPKLFAGDIDFYGHFLPISMDTQYLGRTKHAQDLNKAAFSLTDLCKYDGVDLVDAHRAMNDVQSTLAVFIKYMQGIRSGQESSVFNFRENFKFQF